MCSGRVARSLAAVVLESMQRAIKDNQGRLQPLNLLVAPPFRSIPDGFGASDCGRPLRPARTESILGGCGPPQPLLMCNARSSHEAAGFFMSGLARGTVIGRRWGGPGPAASLVPPSAPGQPRSAAAH